MEFGSMDYRRKNVTSRIKKGEMGDWVCGCRCGRVFLFAFVCVLFSCKFLLVGFFVINVEDGIKIETFLTSY